MLNLEFKQYPKDVPPDGLTFFFVCNDGLSGIISTGYAVAQTDWNNDDNGIQLAWTGKETAKEQSELLQDGYLKVTSFFPEFGSGSPQGNFLWCLVDAFGDLYEVANPDEF